MKTCPACNSSMLLQYDETPGLWERVWKCLGCGREIFCNMERQREDDTLRAQIRWRPRE